LVAGCRISLLKIGKTHAELWPDHYYSDMDEAILQYLSEAGK
jgi:hypothetical protein